MKPRILRRLQTTAYRSPNAYNPLAIGGVRDGGEPDHEGTDVLGTFTNIMQLVHDILITDR